MKTPDFGPDPLPGWYFPVIILAIIAAFIWASNEDYQMARMIECASHGLSYDRQHDRCVK